MNETITKKGTIHIYGDSHSEIYEKINIMETEIIVHKYSQTMHSFCIDTPDISDVKDGDMVFFCYGEVDVRCRIGPQIEKGRELKEITTTLAKNYIKTIRDATKERKNVIRVIILPIPPSYRPHDIVENPDSAIGTVSDRILNWNELKNSLITEIENVSDTTRQLDLGLTDKMEETVIIFNPYEDLSYPGPFIDISMLDYMYIHFHETFIPILKTKLILFLYKIGKIRMHPYHNCINYEFINDNSDVKM